MENELPPTQPEVNRIIAPRREVGPVPTTTTPPTKETTTKTIVVSPRIITLV
jgi:hypothetical protein